MALPLVGIAARLTGGAALRGAGSNITSGSVQLSVRSNLPKSQKDFDMYVTGLTRRIQNQTRKTIRNDTPVVTGRAKAGWKNTKKPKKSDKNFTISNNVPYIGAINEGHSKGKKNYVPKAIKRTKV